MYAFAAWCFGENRGDFRSDGNGSRDGMSVSDERRDRRSAGDERHDSRGGNVSPLLPRLPSSSPDLLAALVVGAPAVARSVSVFFAFAVTSGVK